MIKRTAQSIAMAAFLLVMLLVSGIARAQAGSNVADPFARLDAQLSDAASRTLDRAVQPDPADMAGPPLRHEGSSLALIVARGDQSASRRVERLRPVLEPILREVGIPAELAAVVQVESGGDAAALSPKGARGLWQLMPDTARRYGLVVDGERDERLDLLKSTRAAAEYLRDLYAQFQSWPLALAAYNAGEQAVERALTRTGKATFSAAARALPLETQNYVPAVLHALPRFSAAPSFRTGGRLNVVYAAASQ